MMRGAFFQYEGTSFKVEGTEPDNIQVSEPEAGNQWDGRVVDGRLYLYQCAYKWKPRPGDPYDDPALAETALVALRNYVDNKTRRAR
jgi:hypothetical protein